MLCKKTLASEIMSAKLKMSCMKDLQVPKSESCGFQLLLISWPINAS